MNYKFYENMIKTARAFAAKRDKIDFFRLSRASNHKVKSRPLSWSKIERIRDFMFVLSTSKNEENPIKNKG